MPVTTKLNVHPESHNQNATVSTVDVGRDLSVSIAVYVRKITCGNQADLAKHLQELLEPISESSFVESVEIEIGEDSDE